MHLAILHLCWLLLVLKVAWPGYWPRTAQGNADSLLWPHLSEPENHTTHPFLSRSSHFIFFHLSRWPNIRVVVVQSLSHVQLFATPWTAACQAHLSSTISQSLLRYMYIESVMLPNISSSAIPSPFAFNISQHQNLFQWVCSWHQMANVLELQFQHQSFQWIFSVDFPWDWLVWSLSCTRDSQESSPAL